MEKNKWLYLSGLIVVLLVALFIINKDKFIKSEAEKQREVITAVQKEDLGKLKEYIDKNYSLTFLSKEGFTPLELALNERSIATAKLLLENGADINKKSTTSLYVQILSMLDNYQQIGKNPDYQKMMDNHIELLKIAHNKNLSNIQATDTYGNTALHSAAISGHPQIIKYVIQLGAKPTVTNKEYETPLMLAVKEGQIQAVQVLYPYYDKKLDIDKEGNTLLYSAAMNGREDILQLLLKKSKGEINSKNNEGKTAVIIAAEYGYSMIVEILLRNGADSEIKSNEGKTALDYAKKWKHKEIINLLK